MDLRLKHVGVAVADLARAIPVYTDLFGYRLLSGPFDDPIQQVSVCFMGHGDPGEIEIELVAPLTPQSPVRRMLANGGGAYHTCYETPDLDASVAELTAKRCVLVSEPAPAVAFEGRRIVWLFTPTRQLLELVERP
jgi:methylmalonyl-CoA/ethylmalonyl-CoA epimerase